LSQLPASTDTSLRPLWVLDTNIVLDVFLFADPAVQPLREALAQARIRWISTAPMREELARVLGYPHIAKRMDFYQRSFEDLLRDYDTHSDPVEIAPRASLRCKDPDDQCFIDLALAQQAGLLSKDHAVLCMAKRLRALGVSYVGTVLT
jgi:putative PIN family toxin of toxin-antitoxin system